MKSGIDLCLESNFTNQGKDTILSLLETYNYESYDRIFGCPFGASAPKIH